ncbi:hypothetical protein ACJX0J_034616, partial [Zea mays]
LKKNILYLYYITLFVMELHNLLHARLFIYYIFILISERYMMRDEIELLKIVIGSSHNSIVNTLVITQITRYLCLQIQIHHKL